MSRIYDSPDEFNKYCTERCDAWVHELMAMDELDATYLLSGVVTAYCCTRDRPQAFEDLIHKHTHAEIKRLQKILRKEVRA